MTRTARRLALAATVAAVGVLAFEAWVATTVLPALVPEVSVEVQDRDGRLLRAWPVADGRWRLATTRADVDRTYLAMLQAFEDRRFRRHAGVDPLALLRAAGQAIRHGRIVSGGSTLTMQVARLLEGGPTGSPSAKLRQIRVALALERRLGKDAILDLYLTLAPFGGNLEGVRAASWAWFGREPKGLTPAEAALLVALPQSPEARRPDRDPLAARAARDRVLARVAADAREADAARAVPVPQARLAMPMLAAHRAEALRPAAGALRLTLDAGMQARLETMLRARIAAWPAPVSAALLVVEHATGAVRAAIGSPDILDASRVGAIDMTQAVRSPGSTLKPLVYGLGFETGLIHPETLLADRPTDFGGYAPSNFDGGWHGEVSVRQALQASLNVPAVAVLDAVGPATLLARLRRAGLAPSLPRDEAPGLALALGGLGLSLTDLVTLYSAMARGGKPVPLALQGETESAVALAPVLSLRAAWHVGDILAGQPAPGGRGATGPAIAWKTGTAWGYRDAWAIGFDGRHTVGVWLGRADAGAVPGLTGASAAAPLLFEAFARLEGVPAPLPPRPADLPDLSHSDLPPGLRRFRPQPDAAGPRIASPPDGAVVDLGLVGAAAQLGVRVDGGRAPFVWLRDGQVLPADPFARTLLVPVAEPGFVRITVIDATGAAARSELLLR